MATRQRIIDGAAAEIRVNGAVATTLDDVMAHTGTSKSQLFHYFPHGKEQLLLAVAELEAARVLSDQQPHLSKLTSWAAWQRWRDVVVERYRKQGQQCPLSTVMSEIGRTPGAQAVSSALIEQWRGEIAAGVRAMQQQGKIAGSVDPSRAAAALLAGIQGGVSVLLNTGDISQVLELYESDAVLVPAQTRSGHGRCRADCRAGSILLPIRTRRGRLDAKVADVRSHVDDHGIFGQFENPPAKIGIVDYGIVYRTEIRCPCAHQISKTVA